MEGGNMTRTDPFSVRPSSRPKRSRRVVFATSLVALVAGLLSAPATPAGAAYPGDNGLIAFESTRGIGGDSDIWTANPDGSGLANLTPNLVTDIDPTWSADGDTIAFASNRDGDFDIYTMDADGANVAQVTNISGTQTNPAFSLTGSALAFDSPSNNVLVGTVISTLGLPGLALITSPDLSTPGALTGIVDGESAYSPDGTEIAFTRDLPGPPSDIYTKDLTTGLETLVPLGVGVADSAPDWAPDASQLVIERSGGITVMDTDGTDALPLPFSAGGNNPAFSPDGTQVVFDQFGDITVRDADGTGALGYVSMTGNNANPSWQPTTTPAPPVVVLPPPLPSFERLLVAKSGTGAGTVTSTIFGINCGTDCTEDYLTGTVVTLVATPATGSVFAGWNTAGCLTNVCAFALADDRVVNPVFNLAPPPVEPGAAPAPLDPRCGGLNVICGDHNNNVLVGTAADETILGFSGDDRCEGGGGSDVIVCGDGNNVIRGGAGNDDMTGGKGRDHMRGGSGNDSLTAGAGKDRLTGGAGHDFCNGGPGRDLVQGCES
jgi:Tol biopolymer transport system component